MSEWSTNWRSPQRNYYGGYQTIIRDSTVATSGAPQALNYQDWDARPERLLNLQNEDNDATSAYFKLPNATELPTGFIYHFTNDSEHLDNTVVVMDYGGTQLFRMEGVNVTTDPIWQNIKSCIVCLVDNSTSAGKWAHYRNSLSRGTVVNTTMTKATTTN